MNRLFKWLREAIFRSSVTANSESVEVRVSQQEVVMPDIYGETHEETRPMIKMLDPSVPGIDKSNGFDPYDTVVLHEKAGPK